MKILHLIAKNIKGLKAVSVDPSGNIVEISGKNGQGKTSVLDCIWMALKNSGIKIPEPIRQGEDEAIIYIDLGDYTVTRKFTRREDGEVTTLLTVKNRDGFSAGNPQTVIDGFMGELSFDPLAFARMEPLAQHEALRRFLPKESLDEIEKLKRDSAAAYDLRTEINRTIKDNERLAESAKVEEGWPTEEIDEAKLIEELGGAAKYNADIELRKTNRAKANENIVAWRKQATELQAKAEQSVRDAQAALETARVEAVEIEKEAAELEAKILAAGPLKEPVSTDELQAKLTGAKEHNRRVGLRKEKSDYLTKAKVAGTDSAHLTASLDSNTERIASIIASQKMPVPGLSFGDGAVLMDGVPFAQVSSAQQIKVSVAIAMALNPKLKVVRVKDGSLLDNDSMKMLADMADAADCQVWIERVDGTGESGFVIEDGMVKGAAPVVLPEMKKKDKPVQTSAATVERAQAKAESVLTNSESLL